jgi:GDP-mannose 6-dehydrogenase
MAGSFECEGAGDERMKINVFGLGYVGSLTAICLARNGHAVKAIDVVREKVAALNAGRLSMYEPGLEEVLEQVRAGAGGTVSSTGQDEFKNEAEASIVCVGTPSLAMGRVDLHQLEGTLRTLGRQLRGSKAAHAVIVRSTVPPGTMESVAIPTLKTESGRTVGDSLSVCFYPEFLREGSAVKDFYSPSLNVVGSSHPSALELIAAVFSKVDRPPLLADYRTAEMLKYANNSFHATKVAFANEIGTVAKAHGVDSRALMKLFCSDTTLNISPYYLTPGFAFGGSCLPKELRGLQSLAAAAGMRLPLLGSVLPSNEEHVARLLSILQKSSKSRIGFSGVTFKPETDDLRESPLLTVLETLLRRPSYVTDPRILVFEGPEVCSKLKAIFGGRIEAGSDFGHFIQETDLLVLGPRKLSDDQLRLVVQRRPAVVDLMWHPLPDAIRTGQEFESIC